MPKPTTHLIFMPLVENGPWYLPVAEGEHVDLTDPRLAGLEEEMRLYGDNQHAHRVVLTKDMSAQMLANWEVEPYLVEGRWIDAEDNAANRRVCVVPDGFGLSVGDTLTMSIRDLADPDYLNGYLYAEADLSRLGDIAQGPAEVVGVFDTVREADFTPYIFAPASALPEGFTQPGTFLGRDAFELVGPEAEEAFLTELREPLQALGVSPLMAESGWASFRAAAEPLSPPDAPYDHGGAGGGPGVCARRASDGPPEGRSERGTYPALRLAAHRPLTDEDGTHRGSRGGVHGGARGHPTVHREQSGAHRLAL